MLGSCHLKLVTCHSKRKTFYLVVIILIVRLPCGVTSSQNKHPIRSRHFPCGNPTRGSPPCTCDRKVVNFATTDVEDTNVRLASLWQNETDGRGVREWVRTVLQQLQFQIAQITRGTRADRFREHQLHVG
jgi:hypothetical protein